jgi:hypothetical protein
MLYELQLDMREDIEGNFLEDRSAAATVAAALQEAAAGSRSGSLHITSCKLTAAGFDSTAILRALPASRSPAWRLISAYQPTHQQKLWS